MNASWRTETGHLWCRWSEAVHWTPYIPNWMKDFGDARDSYRLYPTSPTTALWRAIVVSTFGSRSR